MQILWIMVASCPLKSAHVTPPPPPPFFSNFPTSSTLACVAATFVFADPDTHRQTPDNKGSYSPAPILIPYNPPVQIPNKHTPVTPKAMPTVLLALAPAAAALLTAPAVSLNTAAEGPTAALR